MIRHMSFARVRLGGSKAAWVGLVGVLGSSAAGLVAADWPQYRGVNVDGRTPEKIAEVWPAGGLKALWRVPTTSGFSTFSVGDSRCYTLMARELDGAKREVCVAFDAATGRELWSAALGSAKYDGGGDSGVDDNKGGDGPRSTPTLGEGAVYVLGAHLGLWRIEAGTGKILWSKDLVKEHGARPISWQSAASPILDGGALYLCSGAEGGALMALRPADGGIIWKGENDKMTHATPVPVTIHGVRQVVFFTQTGLVSAEARSGQVLWRYPFRYSVSTAASPVVAGEIVYCTAGYGVGSAAVRVVKDGAGWAAKEMWRVADNRVANHWSTPVLRDGYLYGMFGFKEYGRCALKCVELATGKEVWAKGDFGPGGVILVGDKLLALGDRGQLVLAAAEPKGYRELARMQAVSGKCWNHATFSGGRVFARSTTEGVCLDAAVQTSLTVTQ
jgi:outer membrane protein assembly factor BamB